MIPHTMKYADQQPKSHYMNSENTLKKKKTNSMKPLKIKNYCRECGKEIPTKFRWTEALYCDECRDEINETYGFI